MAEEYFNIPRFYHEVEAEWNARKRCAEEHRRYEELERVRRENRQIARRNEASMEAYRRYCDNN